MSFGEKAMRRACALANARRARVAREMAARFDRIAGVLAAVSDVGVELSGRGLVRRWLSDARLRFGAGR